MQWHKDMIQWYKDRYNLTEYSLIWISFGKGIFYGVLLTLLVQIIYY